MLNKELKAKLKKITISQMEEIAEKATKTKIQEYDEAGFKIEHRIAPDDVRLVLEAL